MPDLLYPVLAIKINDIDGETHSERVDSLAWDNPQAFSLKKLFSAQQSFSALTPTVRDICGARQLGLTGCVYNPQATLRCIASFDE